MIPNEGHIFIPELPTNESLWLPLFTSEQTYAGITITNLDENHTDFYIGSVLPFVTETGLATDKHIIYEFVENTWNFSSSIEKAEITFEWDSSKQLPEFNSEDCSVYHSDGTSWAIQDSFSPEYEKITTTHALNGYFAIANKLILLPISLEYFYIGNKNGIGNQQIATPSILKNHSTEYTFLHSPKFHSKHHTHTRLPIILRHQLPYLTTD